MPTKEDLKQSVPFEEILNRKGATPEYLANKLMAELEAEHITEYYNGDGQLTGEKNAIAWSIRQQARMDAHKLKGDYPSEKVEHTVTLEDKLRAIHEKRDKED